MRNRIAALWLLAPLGLLAGCEPPGPEDVKLTAPPGAVSPKVSEAKKSHGLTYTIAESDTARTHAVQELVAQGFTRCEHPDLIPWIPLVVVRDGRSVKTMHMQEQLFRRLPPRIAYIDLTHQPEGIAVRVKVEQILTGEVVDSRRVRFCPTPSQ